MLSLIPPNALLFIYISQSRKGWGENLIFWLIALCFISLFLMFIYLVCERERQRDNTNMGLKPMNWQIMSQNESDLPKWATQAPPLGFTFNTKQPTDGL